MRRHLRIARPVSNLARSTALYRDGLGIDVLGRFDDHDGFDGAMLGPAESDWHVELTHCRTHPVRPQPTPEDLLVLYVPDAGEWRTACDRMLAAGFVAVASFNPYWDGRDARSRTRTATGS
jgi:catechol 2,3-dioxygenase-like lactoylglutathione lyase family enzyme